jgi:8-oxo-dGTP diphosphatase
MNSKDLSDIVKVTVAILVKDNKIIIAKRGHDDRLANKWEFPGGKIEINETPEQCLKREIDLKDHDEFKWISLEQLPDFDFAPADRVFVEKLQNGEIAIQP